MLKTSLAQGVENIKGYLKQMPKAPGVYQMKDQQGDILYIGKAKMLPKRVINYTQPDRLSYRIKNMVSQVVEVEIITTKTELEALLLEANLIKKHSPKYNILLKDGKSYPYIYINTDHDFPRVLKHRGKQKGKGKYFGPFASAGAVNQTITDLQKAFLIRPCSDNEFESRTRPCMEYQIKRCSAPCVGKISQADYHELIEQTLEFLNGKSRPLQDGLLKKMEQASAEQDYEQAASLRDRIGALNHIQAKQDISLGSLKDADIVVVAQQGEHYCVHQVFYRAGHHLGAQSYFPKHTYDVTPQEVAAHFVMQTYQQYPAPKLLLCDLGGQNKLIEEGLETVSGYHVTCQVPQRGAKLRLMEVAVENAKRILAQHVQEHYTHLQLLGELKNLLDLNKDIRRIEVFDNSHIQGKHEVGAMIVATHEGFTNKAYRLFNIKGSAKGKGDDYGMLREVLLRRYGRLKKEHPHYRQDIWPDLILIDGGKGQLSIAKEVFAQLELTIPFVCIAKGPNRDAGHETFFSTFLPPFSLLHADPVMHLLQIMRDEAHRFAIGAHRKKRSKSTFTSALDELPGVGAKRKKQLLSYFGSARGVEQASIEDLRKVDGISANLAKTIYDYLHS